MRYACLIFYLLITLQPFRSAVAATLHMPTGAYEAALVDVIDGDTVRLRIRIWIDQDITTNVRVRGIDAAELRASCVSEKKKALAARTYLEKLLRTAPVLYVRNIAQDKYGGRVVADLLTSDRQNIAQLMLDRDYARHYDGGKRQGWCS